MISGFETRELIESQLAALEREARGHTRDERHRAEIAAQIEIFKTALRDIEATGDPVEEKRRGRATTVRNSTSGQTYQSWVN